ncbi:FAD-dependent oxidoreductase [Streptomyces sp. H10-C2]|uniref:FAD-dependent oxidoreductase n=1 Tax=unclassified Streptomyces TaxID=2593676 RepID=UPI0024B986DB|nr:MULTISPECIES: FAD-dependent oxidoreductase [unclassified Streptomyces]MDJ0345674.1 FAD-dependent oxidoreductase [Streptomyces sp. PH10-H1]MDJ0374526.1 FAD-dependent oxidoreductase [Streptomyces sp. H10-C2]
MSPIRRSLNQASGVEVCAIKAGLPEVTRYAAMDGGHGGLAELSCIEIETLGGAAVMSRRVNVVGAGIVGLSIAHDLALRGNAVTVIADRSAGESVSGVAAAVWFPYRSGASPSLMAWLLGARKRFEQLATDCAAGVDLREGIVVERHMGADRSWTEVVPHHQEATADELPSEAVAGVRATVPVISMPHYLPWLEKRCASLGVRFVDRTVASVDDVAGDADLVVVAAGMGSGVLLNDDSMFPVQGQIVRLANPGITEWITDVDNPAGLTYIVPRREDIVCGGVAQVGSWVTEPVAEVEQAILRRVVSLMPALAGLPILSRATGLRPARDTIRLEHVDGYPVPVIACYGHGGAGVTLSWGCAEAVADLADQT